MNTDHERFELDRLVRQGAASLAASCYGYWPSSGANEIPEGNIALHLGHALLNDGFLCFSEAHSHEAADRRFDLLALRPREGLFIVGEFKRLYSVEKAREMRSDVERIKKFALQGSDRRYPGLNFERGWGLLAATTWDAEYARWFNSNEEALKDPAGGAFTALLEALPPGDATWWNSFTLVDYHDKGGKPQKHSLVYALFPLSS